MGLSALRGFLSYNHHASKHIHDHLANAHKTMPPAHETEGPVHQTPQQSVIELQRHAPQILEARALSQTDRTTLIKAKFEDALIAFIVCLNLSFSTVESPWFIALLTTTSNLVGNSIHLPTSHNTVTSWAKTLYYESKSSEAPRLSAVKNTSLV